MVVRAVVTALALFLTSAALADDWKEYENQDYSFAIHFPVAPTVEAAIYQAADGRSGYEVFPRERPTPEALGSLQKADIEKWWPIIKESGIKAQCMCETKVETLRSATQRLREWLLRVKTSRRNMSAAAAAFAESGHKQEEK